MSDPSAAASEAEEFVKNNREELMEVLLNGDRTLRALAIAILLEGGDGADVELVKRELELYEELDKKVRDRLK
jgi:hypothetical protein